MYSECKLNKQGNNIQLWQTEEMKMKFLMKLFGHTLHNWSLWVFPYWMGPSSKMYKKELYQSSSLWNYRTFVPKKVKVKEIEVVQSCSTLCDSMDCSLPGFSIHEIFQARVQEWVAISFSRGYSQLRDRTQVSHIAGKFFTTWATRKVQRIQSIGQKVLPDLGRRMNTVRELQQRVWIHKKRTSSSWRN